MGHRTQSIRLGVAPHTNGHGVYAPSVNFDADAEFQVRDKETVEARGVGVIPSDGWEVVFGEEGNGMGRSIHRTWDLTDLAGQVSC